MTVSYIHLADQDGWKILKCFYNGGYGYGEFFLRMNPETAEISFSVKDSEYQDALCDAFSEAMS